MRGCERVGGLLGVPIGSWELGEIGSSGLRVSGFGLEDLGSSFSWADRSRRPKKGFGPQKAFGPGRSRSSLPTAGTQAQNPEPTRTRPGVGGKGAKTRRIESEGGGSRARGIGDPQIHDSIFARGELITGAGHGRTEELAKQLLPSGEVLGVGPRLDSIRSILAKLDEARSSLSWLLFPLFPLPPSALSSFFVFSYLLLTFAFPSLIFCFLPRKRVMEEES